MVMAEGGGRWSGWVNGEEGQGESVGTGVGGRAVGE